MLGYLRNTIWYFNGGLCSYISIKYFKKRIKKLSYLHTPAPAGGIAKLHVFWCLPLLVFHPHVSQVFPDTSAHLPQIWFCVLSLLSKLRFDNSPTQPLSSGAINIMPQLPMERYSPFSSQKYTGIQGRNGHRMWPLITWVSQHRRLKTYTGLRSWGFLWVLKVDWNVYCTIWD